MTPELLAEYILSVGAALGLLVFGFLFLLGLFFGD